MSKIKKDNLARYEILYIVSNEFSEEEVKEIDTKVQTIVEDNKATITKKRSLGKRQLSYKIQNFDYGYYNLIVFETERLNVANIDRLIKQMRELLRYCIVISEDEEKFASQTNQEPTQEKDVKKTSVIKKQPEKTIAAKPKPKVKEEKLKTEDKKESIKTEEKADHKKDSKEGLDQKLDDILEAKNLF